MAFSPLDKRKTFRLLVGNTRKYLQQLNLFPSTPPATEHQTLRIQLISTRIFIILLIASLYVFFLYSFTASFTKSATVPTPDRETYSQLYQKYSQTLTCPCTEISINYGTFLHVNYSLHELCSSIFVSEQWFQYINDNTWGELHGTYWLGDFRVVAPQIFHVLASFCNLIVKSISDNLLQFYSNSYISAVVIPKYILEVQSEKFVDEFTSSTTNSFLLSLRMMRETTQINALQSAELSNYYHLYHLSTNATVTGAVWYDDGCSCSFTSTCKKKLPVSRSLAGDSEWYVPGLYTGCFTIEALLQSSLTCFYYQDCIDELQWYVRSRSPVNARALNPSKSTRFHPDTTISDILNQLMVEEWSYVFTYDQYYAACQPKECSYTISSRNNVIYIVTAFIGLIGGLIKALQITVPRIVSFITKMIRRRTARIALIGAYELFKLTIWSSSIVISQLCNSMI